MMSPSPKALRCAIYTRKSSEEGLDQAYNSLDAQRDACAAYILSQAGEGWTALPTPYDDGGFSGGSMERPALRQLLADIEAGRVDVVVVYKVDRLTRALSDFSRIIEILDRAGSSFVSVTQAFNTTTSMGRLTLNVLLSFAQFEREVTGERIRDKIAASKKLGMWMGGRLPLGYRAAGRTLEIHPEEAELVRHIFRRYLEVGSVHQLRDELERQGVVSKQWVSANGTNHGGRPLGRGALFHLLRNRTYIGQIPHKDVSYPGQHPAIVDAAMFEAVQCKLEETATVLRRPQAAAVRRAHRGAPLKGMIFDSAGHAMSPVAAQRKGGVRYRYYVSRALQVGQPQKAGACPRVPAPEIEALIESRLVKAGLTSAADPTDWTELRESLRRVDVAPQSVTLTLTAAAIAAAGGSAWVRQKLQPGDRLDEAEDGERLVIGVALARRGGRCLAVGPSGEAAIHRRQIDATLGSALIKAEAWKRRLMSGDAATLEDLVKDEGVQASYARRLLRVAFLAPDLKRSILEGTQPMGLSLQAIVTDELPLDWQAQRAMFAK